MIKKTLILRLYCRGEVIRSHSEDWNKLYSIFFPSLEQDRSLLLKIELVETSCGYGVPIYEFQAEIKTLIDWAAQKGELRIRQYREKTIWRV